MSPQLWQEGVSAAPELQIVLFAREDLFKHFPAGERGGCGGAHASLWLCVESHLWSMRGHAGCGLRQTQKHASEWCQNWVYLNSGLTQLLIASCFQVILAIFDIYSVFLNLHPKFPTVVFILKCKILSVIFLFFQVFSLFSYFILSFWAFILNFISIFQQFLGFLQLFVAR